MLQSCKPHIHILNDSYAQYTLVCNGRVEGSRGTSLEERKEKKAAKRPRCVMYGTMVHCLTLYDVCGATAMPRWAAACYSHA